MNGKAQVSLSSSSLKADDPLHRVAVPPPAFVLAAKQYCNGLCEIPEGSHVTWPECGGSVPGPPGPGTNRWAASGEGFNPGAH